MTQLRQIEKSNFIKFRPDIEGMRAIAVLSVLLFHMGFSAIPGGFVGVDIFFVISGFLITQDIYNRSVTEKFNLMEFYLRRVRRIFPSLIAVLIASTVAAVFILLPSELENFSKSALSASISLSNIYFFKKNDYFSPSAEEMPLLHTWSLGVEEQFYIFWPMVIVLSLKFFGRHGVKAVLSAVIIISLICSELLLKSNPSFSFYMLPARAWELAIGGLLGLSGNLGLQIKKSVAGVLVSAGILIVGYSIFFFEKTTPFPGLHALIPCIGAALIIFGGQFENLVSSFLCNVVMKYIGRISYPLYLVHWPIIVFWGLASTTEVSMAVKLVQIAVMFGAAHVLYAGVEPIFRRISATRARMKVWAPMAVAPVIAMGLVCASMLFTNGLQGRHPMPAWVSQAAAESSSFQRDPCLMRGAELSTSAQCVIGDPTRQPTLVLWGDSHATQLIPAFRESLIGK